MFEHCQPTIQLPGAIGCGFTEPFPRQQGKPPTANQFYKCLQKVEVLQCANGQGSGPLRVVLKGLKPPETLLFHATTKATVPCQRRRRSQRRRIYELDRIQVHFVVHTRQERSPNYVFFEDNLRALIGQAL